MRIELDGRDITDKVKLETVERWGNRDSTSISFSIGDIDLIPGDRLVLWSARRPGFRGWLRSLLEIPWGVFVVTELKFPAGTGRAIDYETYWRRNRL